MGGVRAVTFHYDIKDKPCNQCPEALPYSISNQHKESLCLCPELRRHILIDVNLRGHVHKIVAGAMQQYSCDHYPGTVSYTHLRAHETPEHLVCRLLLEK